MPRIRSRSWRNRRSARRSRQTSHGAKKKGSRSRRLLTRFRACQDDDPFGLVALCRAVDHGEKSDADTVSYLLSKCNTEDGKCAVRAFRTQCDTYSPVFGREERVSLLSLACMKAYDKTVTTLIKSFRFPAKGEDSSSEPPPLYFALTPTAFEDGDVRNADRSSTVRVLLDESPGADYPLWEGHTVLMFAALYVRERFMWFFLLERFKNTINHIFREEQPRRTLFCFEDGWKGKTALMMAVVCQSALAVLLLMRNGASAHLTDSSGRSAIQMAHDMPPFFRKALIISFLNGHDPEAESPGCSTAPKVHRPVGKCTSPLHLDKTFLADSVKEGQGGDPTKQLKF